MVTTYRPTAEMEERAREFDRALLPLHETILIAKKRVYGCMEAAIVMACAHFDLPDPRVLPNGLLTLTLSTLPATMERVGTRYELRYGGQDGALIAWGEEESVFSGTHFTVNARFDFTDWFAAERRKRGFAVPRLGDVDVRSD